MGVAYFCALFINYRLGWNQTPWCGRDDRSTVVGDYVSRGRCGVSNMCVTPVNYSSLNFSYWHLERSKFNIRKVWPLHIEISRAVTGPNKHGFDKVSTRIFYYVCFLYMCSHASFPLPSSARNYNICRLE